MKFPLVILSLLSFALAGCQRDYGQPDKTAIPVTITDLLREPEKYRERLVRVRGYLHLEFESQGLYATYADYLTVRGESLKRSLWVDTRHRHEQMERFNDSLVVVEGIFYPQNHGHLGLFGGMIARISFARAEKFSAQQQNEPNKSPEPTPTAVTPRATEGKSK